MNDVLAHALAEPDNPTGFDELWLEARRYWGRLSPR